MARARNLKPSFFTDDELAEIEPLGRLLFQGLWCLADRAGRLEDRPKRIKAEILPYDECDVENLLHMLHSRQFITRYEANGIRYIQVVNFAKHQNPHVREPVSTIPAPCEHSAPPGNSGTGPADSGFLIPDSGFPLSLPNGSVSGKPDVARLPKPKTAPRNDEAREVLDFLNERAGRRFPASDSNLGIIVARFKEGFTPLQLRQVVVLKARKWKGDEKMAEYLRPETLFGRQKFSSYVGELVPDDGAAA